MQIGEETDISVALAIGFGMDSAGSGRGKHDNGGEVGMERGQATKGGGGGCQAKPHKRGTVLLTERKDCARDPPAAWRARKWMLQDVHMREMCCRGPPRKKRGSWGPF